MHQNFGIFKKKASSVWSNTKKYHFPLNKTPNVIGDIAGGFEFYIADANKVGHYMGQIITVIVKSGCAEYTTMEDFDSEFLKEVKNIFGNIS